MIINPPSAESLNEVALRLYFSAWSSLIGIIHDFDLHFDVAGSADDDDDTWSEERKEYLEACQPELQSICTIVQQSNELALKARICEVSPFLLLLKSEPKFSTTGSDIEFSDLRTLDAVDLPGAVNTLSARTLSDEFVQTYNLFRSLRNKVAHLGSADAVFTPEDLLKKMLFQYQQLWPERMWLKEWVQAESNTRLSYFHDYSNSSPYADVFAQWPLALKFIGKSDFKRLFGVAKSQRRYLCLSCIRLGTTDWNDIRSDPVHTAFLVKGADRTSCFMCGEEVAVERSLCHQDHCKGNVICTDPEGENDRICLTCGEDASGVAD